MKIKIKTSEKIDIYCALILLVQFTPVFCDFDAIVRKSEKCIASVLHEFDFFYTILLEKNGHAIQMLLMMRSQGYLEG